MGKYMSIDHELRECEQCNKKDELYKMCLNVAEILIDEVTEKQINDYEHKNNVSLDGWFCDGCASSIIKTLEQWLVLNLLRE